MHNYMNSMDRFDETSLLCKNHLLVGNSISMLNVYGINSISKHDYHDIYLKSDVLLFVDFFEKFHNTCLQQLLLGSSTLLYRSWISMGCCTQNAKCSIETDIDMYTFIENSIRGGISMISDRYAKSNNMYNMCFKSDPEKPKSNILDLDA